MYGVKIEQEEEDAAQQQKPQQKRKDSGGLNANSTRQSSPSLVPTGKLYNFVVMNAVFPAQANRFISERFDLKGSTVGREVSDEELKSKGNNAVLKDLDLAREVDMAKSKGSKEYGLTIGAAAKAALLSQLRDDVKLLVECKVMDYSLLVGIVHMDAHLRRDYDRAISTLKQQERILGKFERTEKKKKLDAAMLYALTTPIRLVLSPPIYVAKKALNLARLTLDSIFTTPLPYYGSGTCGVNGGKYSVFHGKRRGDRAIYYLGLIDFLQPWTTRKIVERKLKALLGYDTNAISAVTPEEYASRFLDFLEDNIS
jgi:1-phosphatidylinositol-4-phosphate 5-kinase